MKNFIIASLALFASAQAIGSEDLSVNSLEEGATVYKCFARASYRTARTNELHSRYFPGYGETAELAAQDAVRQCRRHAHVLARSHCRALEDTCKAE